MEQNRLKSPVVWASIGALVLGVLLNLGVINSGQSEAVNTVVAGVLQALTVFGVLNNPTVKDGF